MSYNPVKNVDFGSLPNYAVANVPILSYLLIGITTLTLGYITIKDKEGEKSSDGISDSVKGGQPNHQNQNQNQNQNKKPKPKSKKTYKKK